MATQVTVRIVNGFVTPGRAWDTRTTVATPQAWSLTLDDLSEADMQSVAAAVGHSEDCLRVRIGDRGLQIRFFSRRARRIAHCGHATIAAFGISRGDWPAQ